MTEFDVTKHAQDCAAFIELRRIADWVGDGKPVTSKGVLRPADLRRASAETSGRRVVRQDIAELQHGLAELHFLVDRNGEVAVAE